MDNFRIEGCSIDLFSEKVNALEPEYITEKEDAFTFDWGKLAQKYPCWCNPPFSKMLEVVTKIVIDKARVLLCAPTWGFVKWRKILDKIIVHKVILPRRKLYKQNHGK